LLSLEALSLWNKATRESIIRYGQIAQEIVDAAPEDALGYAHLGWYYWGLATYGIDFSRDGRAFPSRTWFQLTR